MSIITLIRGLPGSGKSTLATKLNKNHVEADMFFMKNNRYVYDNKKIKDAHEWCQSTVKFNLQQNKDIVVSNTFTSIFEIATYFKIAYHYHAKIKIIECKGNYENIHNIHTVHFFISICIR